jgi:inorganic pyrophosphatase
MPDRLPPHRYAQSDSDGDRQKRNDRLIAVAQVSVLYAEVAQISDLTPALLHQIEAFFVNYQKVRDIGYEIESREGPRAAHKALQAASEKKAA